MTFLYVCLQITVQYQSCLMKTGHGSQLILYCSSTAHSITATSRDIIVQWHTKDCLFRIVSTHHIQVQKQKQISKLLTTPVYDNTLYNKDNPLKMAETRQYVMRNIPFYSFFNLNLLEIKLKLIYLCTRKRVINKQKESNYEKVFDDFSSSICCCNER